MGGHDILGLDEVLNVKSGLWRKLLAEFLGVLFIVFLGTGSAVGGWDTGDQPTLFRVAFAFGFAVAAVVEIVGHVSGGHVNPAITMALMVVRRVKILPGLLYIGFQLLGGIAGSALLHAMTPLDLQVGGMGQNRLGAGLTAEQGMAVEWMTTCLLVLTVFALTDENRPEFKGSVSLAVGVTVTVGHLFSIRYTGCGMNPARVFGPTVMTGHWDNQWAYWVGECAGGVTAALLYIAAFQAGGERRSPLTNLKQAMNGKSQRQESLSDGLDMTMSKESIPVSAVSIDPVRRPTDS